MCAEPQATGFVARNDVAAAFSVAASCPFVASNPYGGVYVGTSTSGVRMARGTVASWTLTAPAGTTFDAVSVRRKLTRVDTDYVVEVVKPDGTVVDACLSDNICDGGFDTPTYRRAREFTFRVRCAAQTCDTSTQGPRAALQITSGTARVEDTAPPEIATPAVAWQRTADVAVSATDASGIAALEVATTDRALGTESLACDYRFLRPCAPTGATTVATGLLEGSHPIVVRATDAAGLTATTNATLKVDRTPPASPQGVSVQPTANGRYAYTWTNPDQGANAPIAAAHLSDGTVVKGANIQQLQSASPVERIYLEDEAGNADSATAVGTSSGQPLTLNPPILESTTQPKLKLSSARRRGTRLVVKGTVTNATASKVTVTVKRGSRTVRKSASLSRGRFTIRIALNSTMRRKGTVSVTVRHGTAKASKRVRF